MNKKELQAKHPDMDVYVIMNGRKRDYILIPKAWISNQNKNEL